ncbi:hypothetical protein KKF91_21460 [Myxococcota bacterium]|nr:hypothetical protein [Myxococcota bacterium]MBU1433114.1 hypothetical protein [Myxococcota bacterium]MBU1900049.1 hypothetical protein [Myxococcota bacterium]
MPPILLCLALMAPSIESLSLQRREQLRARLAAATVTLRRPMRLQAGFQAPPDPYLYARAWRASPRLLLTAQAFLDDPPRLNGGPPPPLQIEAKLEGAWWPFEILKASPRWGWAALKSKGVADPPLQLDAFKLPSGSRLFAAHQGRLFYYEITRPAEDQRAYFVWAAGAPLPLGAPLFDETGAFRTLIGLPSPDRDDAALTLPDVAFLDLFEGADGGGE